jgi:galactonate dehydratase
VQPIFDFHPASPSSFIQTIPGLGNVTLAQLETWITSPAKGGNGWGEMKSCLFVRLNPTDGIIRLGRSVCTLPVDEKAVAEIIHAPWVAQQERLKKFHPGHFVIWPPE